MAAMTTAALLALGAGSAYSAYEARRQRKNAEDDADDAEQAARDAQAKQEELAIKEKKKSSKKVSEGYGRLLKGRTGGGLLFQNNELGLKTKLGD